MVLNWLGKSPAQQGEAAHPAVYHMLDVAAVAERLIQPFGFDHQLEQALVILVALHDLGKISDTFQALLAGKAQRGPRHWELTEVLLYAHDELIADKLGGEKRRRQYLYAATAGHHGRPPTLALGEPSSGRRPTPDLYRAMEHIGSGAADAAAVIEQFCEFWPTARLDSLTLDDLTLGDMTLQDCRRLSWWLPGLCAAADWIGSNTDWFPATWPDKSPAAYLELARARAAIAVMAAGITGSPPRTGALFDFALRPMQAACAAVELPSGPMLAVIEDETGAGKTEAALLLAHRMVLAGKGRGVFFALPTMATADAMLTRATQIAGKMFDAPTLTLAHGRAGLSASFRDLVTKPQGQGDEPTCTEWLAESRRRALLADFGVGTIDQALLSVLPVKHQTLRHFGLSSKILIVDEVHEMGDPYIAQDLERLLQMHRAAGGSAILLTATLPLGLRQKLLKTYKGHNDDPAYPALTIAGGAAVTDFAPDQRPKKGPVGVVRLPDTNAAVALLVEQSARGAACAWVRNSVDDAIAAVADLRAQGVTAQLLHARFALVDRKRIEAEVQARVGKNGANRAGYVLVATQVLQASLDLDFDVMVSDIAPIAELIQRAGRLWRHVEMRPADTRPVPAPVLHVVSPDPDVVADERWLHGALQGGAWVYSAPDAWRTARVVFKTGQIDAPKGLRTLIEAVYGPDAEPVPEALDAAEARAMGEAAASRALASHNLVDLLAGYRSGGRGDSDAKYPTRLGAETQTLVLARLVDGEYQPWAAQDGLDRTDAWALSEVSAAQGRLVRLPLPDPDQPQIARAIRDWPDWKKAEYRLCPVDQDGMICAGLRYDATLGLSWVTKAVTQ